MTMGKTLDETAMAQSKCSHARLFFGSGGFYVFCRECNATWTATKPGSDAAIDYTRSNNIVSTHDERVAPAHPLLSEPEVARVIQAGCIASDIHLTCSYPECTCKQIPNAIRAVLSLLGKER